MSVTGGMQIGTLRLRVMLFSRHKRHWQMRSGNQAMLRRPTTDRWALCFTE